MSINVNISHREDFPLLRDSNIVYLDNAATSQKPDCVIEAVEEFYHKHNANPIRGINELAMLATEQLENSRTTVKELINAKKYIPEELDQIYFYIKNGNFLIKDNLDLFVKLVMYLSKQKWYLKINGTDKNNHDIVQYLFIKDIVQQY